MADSNAIRGFAALSPQMQGAWYYLGYWGIGGVYLGFVNVFFSRIGLSATQIGILSALVPLLVVSLAPIVAAWADKRAMRVRLVVIGLVGMGVSMIALFFARGFVAVLLAYTLLAVFTSIVPPLADGLVARMGARHGLEYGRMRLWGSLSFAIASGVFGWLWGRIGYEPMFLVAGALFLVFAPTVRWLEEGVAPPPGERFQPSNVTRDAGMVMVLGLSLVIGLGLGLSTPFLGVNIEHLGGNATQVGLLFAFIAIAEVPVMRLESRLARAIGDAGVLALGCACFAGVYGTFALVRDPNILIVTSLLEGCGFALFFVATVRIVDERAASGRSSTLQSFRNGLAFGLAPLMASPTGGALFGAVGPLVFGMTAVLMVVGAIMALAGRRALMQRPTE
jgi:PPP family 3-phenylpropionic acid transporter